MALKLARKSFILPSKELTHWFPGHMSKGMKQMEAKMSKVDCVIEVHDSRIPLTGRNPLLRDVITKNRPHIFILNKVDLITEEDRRNLHKKLLNERAADEIIFTYCKNEQSHGIRKILPTIKKLLKRKMSISVETGTTSDISLMIVGIPNVGKSSLINMLRAKHLRKGNAAPVGAVAGITRSLQEKVKISEDPKIYLFDTPGIMIPAIKDAETGMKLAACATLKDHLVGPELIADFILYWMNKEGIYSYVDVFQLPAPCDNISEVLTRIAISQNKFLSVRQANGEKRSYPDFKHAAEQLLKAFRTGKFGKLMLDRDLM